MEETSKYGVLGQHQPCSEERIEVLSDTRSNAIILHETLPACCIPKAVRMETGEVIFEKVFSSPRPPPKISLKHDWMKELGSEVARPPQSSQPSRSNPNPNHDRTVRPVVCSEQASHPRFSRESQNLISKDVNLDRTGRPGVCRDASHERSLLNEVDIDFRIPAALQQSP